MLPCYDWFGFFADCLSAITCFTRGCFVSREEVSKGDRTPEGRVPRQRIGSRTTKCAGTGSAEGGGQNRQQSPLATPKAISEASTTGASMSKTRKEKISAVLENVSGASH